MKNTVPVEAITTLLHDISGPIATSSGIQHELADSIRALMVEISKLELPPASARRLQDLMATDIEPCMEHLNVSLTNLNDRVKEFSETYS